MNGGKGIVAHGALGNQDRVLVIVAAPGHESDNQVLAKGQLSFVNAWSVRKNLAFFDNIARLAGGFLAKAGILV